MDPLPTDEDPEESPYASSVLRGRKRRRARRQWQALQDQIHQVDHAELRGRARRSHKRRARLTDIKDNAQAFNLFLQPSSPNMDGPSTAPGTFMAIKSRFSQRDLTRFDPLTTSKPRYQQISTDHSLPVWLVDASIDRPDHFRRLSTHLKPASSQDQLCIDESMALAIEEVGGNRSCELLEMLLDFATHPSITIAATMTILSWISLPTWKNIQLKMPLHLSSPKLLLAVISNTENALALLDHLTNEDTQFDMDDETFNQILSYTFESVTGIDTSDRWDLESVEDTNVHVKQCEMYLTRFPKKQVFATTVASAVAAEGALATKNRPPTPLACFETLLNRCKEQQDVSQLLKTALEICSIATIRLLLDRWPKQPLSKIAMLKFFQRSVWSRYSVAAGERNESEAILPYFAARLSTLPPFETLFVNLQDYNEGSTMLQHLRVIDSNLIITPLMQRCALFSFFPEDLEKCLNPTEIDCNSANMLALLDSGHKMRRPHDAQNIKFMLSRSPVSAVTEEVVTAAALSVRADVFEAFLNHNTHACISSKALVAATRSRHSALPKVRLILERTNFKDEAFDTDFWISLVSNNHRDTVEVFELLQSRFFISTNDALIVAAWRTDSGKSLIRRLLKDKSFVLSVRTISAVLLERYDGHKNDAFRWLLNQTKDLVIDGDLIADSFDKSRYCQILLKKHGRPDMLSISAAKLRSILHNINHNVPEIARSGRLLNVEQSMNHYVAAGGRFTLSKVVLEMLPLVDIELALKLWQTQTAIPLLDSVAVSVNLEFKYEKNPVVNLFVDNSSGKIDKAMIDAFSPRQPVTRDQQLRFKNFWDTILHLIYRGELSRFEQVYDRVENAQVPALEVEWLFALLVTKPNGDYYLGLQSREVDINIAEIFAFLTYRFPRVTLGAQFFQRIEQLNSETPAAGRRVEKAWTALLNCPVVIKWGLSSQTVLIATHSTEIFKMVMTTLGDSFVPCEQLVLAAMNSQYALSSVEFLWQKSPDMVVTQSMIEAAVRSTSIETLDFLVARSEPPKITDNLVRIALENITPSADPDSEWSPFGPSWRQTRVVEVLMVQMVDIKLSPLTIELAIRRLKERLARQLLSCASTEKLSRGTILAMLDRKWRADSIHHELTRHPDNMKHLLDPDVVSQACKSDQGRALLSLTNTAEQHHPAIQAALLAEAPLKSTSRNWLILDHLPLAQQIHLTDNELSHLWRESTRSFFSSKQPLLHLLEHGATGRIGPKTLDSFWQTCAPYIDYKSAPRVSGTLPNVPADITDALILVAKYELRGRTAFDYLLGPDHEIKVYESALLECARLGEELWLIRLLKKMSPADLAAVDKQALLKAAKHGAQKRIVDICSALAGRPVTRKNAWRRIVRRERYFARQRRRVGRPKVLNVWRRGFGRFRRRLSGKRRRVEVSS